MATRARAGEIEDERALSGRTRPGKIAHRPSDGRAERGVRVGDPVVFRERGAATRDDSARDVLFGLFDFDHGKRRARAASDRWRACALRAWSRRCRGARRCASATLNSPCTSSAVSPTKSVWISSKKRTTRPIASRTSLRMASCTFGERAAHVGPRDELRDGHLDDDAVVEGRDFVARGNALRDPMHTEVFPTPAGPRGGIVRAAFGEHVESLIDLDRAPDDRIERTFAAASVRFFPIDERVGKSFGSRANRGIVDDALRERLHGRRRRGPGPTRRGTSGGGVRRAEAQGERAPARGREGGRAWGVDEGSG